MTELVLLFCSVVLNIILGYSCIKQRIEIDELKSIVNGIEKVLNKRGTNAKTR